MHCKVENLLSFFTKTSLWFLYKNLLEHNSVLGFLRTLLAVLWWDDWFQNWTMSYNAFMWVVQKASSHSCSFMQKKVWLALCMGFFLASKKPPVLWRRQHCHSAHVAIMIFTFFYTSKLLIYRGLVHTACGNIQPFRHAIILMNRHNLLNFNMIHSTELWIILM